MKNHRQNRRPNYKKLMPSAHRLTRPDGTRYWLVEGQPFESLAAAWAHFNPNAPRNLLASIVKKAIQPAEAPAETSKELS